jgi:hypothetical protein
MCPREQGVTTSGEETHLCWWWVQYILLIFQFLMKCAISELFFCFKAFHFDLRRTGGVHFDLRRTGGVHTLWSPMEAVQ